MHPPTENPPGRVVAVAASAGGLAAFTAILGGLPAERLREPLLALLQGQCPKEALVVDATNRRGRPVRCHVRMNPLTEANGEVAGALILIEERMDGADDGKPRGAAGAA